MKVIETHLFTAIAKADEENFEGILKNLRQKPAAIDLNVLNKSDVNLIQYLILQRFSFLQHNKKDEAARLFRMLISLLGFSNSLPPNTPIKRIQLDQATAKQKTALHFAADYDDTEVLQLLVDQGANLFLRDSLGETILEIASRGKNVAVLLKVIMLKKFPLDSYNPDTNTTPAYNACFLGLDRNLNLLINQGFAYMVPGQTVTLMDVAADQKHGECIRVLANSKYILDPHDLIRALAWSVEYKDQTLFNSLLPKLDSIVVLARDHAHLIGYCIAQPPRDEFARALIDKINLQQDADAEDVLHYSKLYEVCVDNDNGDLAAALRAKRIPLCEDAYGFTAFDKAIINSKTDCIDNLFVADFNFINKFGETPLHRIARMDNVIAFNFYVDKNKKLDDESQQQSRPLFKQKYTFLEKTGDGRTILHYAACANIEILRKVMSLQLLDIHEPDAHGWTPLLHAIKAGYADNVEMLLHAGAVLTNLPKDYESPLHFVIAEGHPELIDLLQKHGLIFDVNNQEKQTAFHLSVEFNRPLMLMAFLQKFDPLLDQIDSNGQTALHLACLYGYFECAVLLIEKANLFIVNNDDQTALHVAAANGHFEITKLLIEKEEKLLSSQDKDGNTPLHAAIQSKNHALIEYLLNLPNVEKLLEIPNNEERTALDMLRENSDLFSIYLKLLPPAKPSVDVTSDLHKNPEEKKSRAHDFAAALVEEIIARASTPPAKKKKKKKKQHANVSDESKLEIAPVSMFTPSSRARLPLSKSHVDRWGNLIYKTQKANEELGKKDSDLVYVSWREWGIPPDLTFHEKLPQLNGILSKALKSKVYEERDKKDGVYVVGSEALSALYLNKVNVQASDMDLLVVGLTMDEIMATLKANNIPFRQTPPTGVPLSLTLEFADRSNQLPPIDITCIPNSEFEKKIYERDFTISGVMLNYSNQDIVAPLPWLQHVKNRLVISIGSAEESFRLDFIRKIRALRLYLKLEHVGAEIIHATENALRDPETSFLNSTVSSRPHAIITLRNHLHKFLDLAGLEKGIELLQEYNLLTQIQIKPQEIRGLFKENLNIPPQAQSRPVEIEFARLLSSLTWSLGMSQTFQEWHDRYATIINKLVKFVDENPDNSLIRKFGMRFISCLLLSGADVNKVLMLNKSPEKDRADIRPG